MKRRATEASFFALPYLAFCGIAALRLARGEAPWGDALWAVVALLAVVTIWRGWVGRFFWLILSLLVWLGAIMLLANTLAEWVPAWLLLPLLVLAPGLVFVAAWRLGDAWGQARAARLRAEGRGIREWQWVYVGRAAALAHPLARPSLGLWVSKLFVMFQATLAVLSLILLDMHWGWQVWLASVVALDIGTLLALGLGAPIAYPLMFAVLALAFTFSTPLLVYWADGVRPNLIYRHRFERLMSGGDT